MGAKVTIFLQLRKWYPRNQHIVCTQARACALREGNMG